MVKEWRGAHINWGFIGWVKIKQVCLFHRHHSFLHSHTKTNKWVPLFYQNSLLRAFDTTGLIQDFVHPLSIWKIWIILCVSVAIRIKQFNSLNYCLSKKNERLSGRENNFLVFFFFLHNSWSFFCQLSVLFGGAYMHTNNGFFNRLEH